MRHIETLTDQERRLMVHVYWALRDAILDELDYDRAPDFPPLTPDTQACIHEEIYGQLTRLMVAAHAEEAATIQQEIDACVVHIQGLMAQEGGSWIPRRIR
jgi:hypothetical protein